MHQNNTTSLLVLLPTPPISTDCALFQIFSPLSLIIQYSTLAHFPCFQFLLQWVHLVRYTWLFPNISYLASHSHSFRKLPYPCNREAMQSNLSTVLWSPSSWLTASHLFKPLYKQWSYRTHILFKLSFRRWGIVPFPTWIDCPIKLVQ